MTIIDTVVFDLGGVLIDWNPRYLYRKLLPEAEVEKFLAEVCTSHWNEQQDAGRPISEANRILEEKFPEQKELIRAFYGRWEEMLAGPIQGTVEILEEIHASRVRLLALSNWSHETFHIAERNYPFLNLFHGKVVSGFEKIKKPDPRIFQLLVKRFQVKPERALFIDDVAANIAAADALGFHGIRFQNPEALASDLAGFSLEAKS